ncbi:DNA repair exonuclease-like protein [Acidithiobacillus sp. GGI-221]|nr:DNA repair exonuclease-like protein [Acidithiobacillus sp. GGI-221]
MRVAHFSDLHFCQEHLAEVDHCMTAAVEAAIKENVELAIISGDATDHRLDLNAPAVSRLAQLVHVLSNQCPVLMLQGTFSHEPPGTLDLFRYMGGRFPVFVSDAIQQVALLDDNQWVSTLEGEGSWVFEQFPAKTKAIISCLPAVNKANLVAALGQDDVGAMGDTVHELLCGFGLVNQRARVEGITTIAVSHGTVNGSLTEHGVPMMGLDHEFTIGALFAAKASAFMLGHIHKSQGWEHELPGYGTQRAAYAGSIGRLHYGEEGEKGWLFWDVDHCNAAYRLMPTPARKLIHLDFPGVPDMETIRAAIKEAPGAFVRVRYSVDEEHRHSVDRDAVALAFKTAGACAVKIEGRVLPILRARAEGISKSGTLDDKLRQWAATTGTDAAPLTERLTDLVHLDVEEILKRITNPMSQPQDPVVAPSIPAPDEHVTSGNPETPVPAKVSQNDASNIDLFS